MLFNICQQILEHVHRFIVPLVLGVIFNPIRRQNIPGERFKIKLFLNILRLKFALLLAGIDSFKDLTDSRQDFSWNSPISLRLFCGNINREGLLQSNTTGVKRVNQSLMDLFYPHCLENFHSFGRRRLQVFGSISLKLPHFGGLYFN